MIKLKYVIAILIFGILIFIHELGHFIAAKCCNVKVLKFAIGMGPKLIKKTIGETEYSLRLLPIGGFCAMEGEDTDAVTIKEIGKEAAGSDSSRALHNKPRWQRFIILLAGPFMNVLLGFVLAVVLACMLKAVPSTVIGSFHKDGNDNISAQSYDCGLREGDEIEKINGMTIFTPSDLSYQLRSGSSETFEVVVERDGEELTLTDVSFKDKTTGDDADFYVKGLSKNPLTVLSYSAKNTVSTARLIWISLKDLVTGKYGLKDMSGPVGVVSAMGSAVDQGTNFKESAMSLMSLTMFITVNLGIANLLPIPGLDGGQILILAIEAVRRKPLKPEHVGIVNLVGLGLVMLLIIAVTFSDVVKLIG